MKKLFYLSFLLMLACVLLTSATTQANPKKEFESLTSVYHIPLRVHLGDSARPVQQWSSILAEINTIWFSQAGICFTIHTVGHDRTAEDGLDLWFEPMISGWNGYFTDPHNMHVRDDPDLQPALNPARSSAARTAAHELGHALGLEHRQDSDDNLMRSKTYGWQLDAEEILQAREAAIELATAITSRQPCPAPEFHPTP